MAAQDGKSFVTKTVVPPKKKKKKLKKKSSGSAASLGGVTIPV